MFKSVTLTMFCPCFVLFCDPEMQPYDVGSIVLFCTKWKDRVMKNTQNTRKVLFNWVTYSFHTSNVVI